MKPLALLAAALALPNLLSAANPIITNVYTVDPVNHGSATHTGFAIGVGVASERTGPFTDLASNGDIFVAHTQTFAHGCGNHSGRNCRCRRLQGRHRHFRLV